MSAAAYAHQLQSEEHSEAVVTELAPFALLRIGGLPVSVLDRLTTDGFRARVREAVTCRAEMEECRGALEDALTAAIPGIAPTETRRAAISIRRDIHNSRATHVAPERVQDAAACLPAPELLLQWADAGRRLNAATAWLENVSADAVELCRRTLGEIAQDPDFSPALALASPELCEQLAREKRSTGSRTGFSKAERSLGRYVVRAATKTSPFSGFTSVGRLVLSAGDSGEPPVASSSIAKRTVVNRGILTRLYLEHLSQPEAFRATVWEINPTLQSLDDSRFSLLLSRQIAMNGRPWLAQRFATFRLHPGVARATSELRGRMSGAELEQLLLRHGVDSALLPEISRHMIEHCFILPPAIIDAFETDTAQVFLSAVTPPAAQDSPPVHSLVRRCADLHKDDAPQRIPLVQQMTAVARAGNERLQLGVLEDCWISEVRGTLSPGLKAQIAEIGAFLQKEIVLRPAYLGLKHLFVARYGAGGVCRDFVGFITAITSPLVNGLREWPRTFNRQRPKRPVDVGLTTFVQIAQAPSTDAWTGKGSLVVNRVFEGVGWLAARYTSGPSADQGALAAAIRQWLRRTSFPREPVDVPICGGCNDLQAHRPLTDRFLAWPGEPVSGHRPGAIPASEMILRHDIESDMLVLSDAHGVDLSLNYLGTVVPIGSWGYGFTLAILAQPFGVLRPAFSSAGDSPGPRPPIVHTPRKTEGSLVLTRARWTLSSAYIRSVWFARSGAACIPDILWSCRQHGIPESFFARALTAADAGNALALDARKPLWIDVHNPLWLDLLKRFVEAAEWIELTEALPDPRQACFHRSGEAHVSEIQVEMIVRTL